MTMALDPSMAAAPVLAGESEPVPEAWRSSVLVGRPPVEERVAVKVADVMVALVLL